MRLIEGIPVPPIDHEAPINHDNPCTYADGVARPRQERWAWYPDRVDEGGAQMRRGWGIVL